MSARLGRSRFVALVLAALAPLCAAMARAQTPAAGSDVYDDDEPPPNASASSAAPPPAKPPRKPATKPAAKPPAKPPAKTTPQTPDKPPAPADPKPKTTSLKPKVQAMTPARVVGPVRAAYPAGGEGEHVVVLDVSLDATGKVLDVVVREGSEPFADAAADAARRFTYQPATRAGRRIPSRLRLRVPFHPGQTNPEPEPSSAPAAGEKMSETPAAPKPIEVVVRGTASTSAELPPDRRFSQRDVASLPGVFGEPFRAVELSPGVSSFASGMPFFFVRGAPPGATGYFVDGVSVPLLFHVGAGPSVIHPALLDSVDVYAGAYPASFGRRVGGVVSAPLREPSDHLRAEGFARLYDVSAFVESPLADGRASVFGAGRISHTAPLFKALSEEVALFYGDYQLGASLRLSSSDRVSVLGFGSRDYLADVDEGEERSVFASSFHRLSLRLDHGRGKQAEEGAVSARLAVTGGVDQSLLDGSTQVSSRSLDVRSDVELPIADELVLRGGADALVEDFTLEIVKETPKDGARFAELFPSRSAGTFGGYVEASLAPSKTWELVPGLRLDSFSENGNGRFALDPRLSLRFGLLPAVTSTTRVGLAHERPSAFLTLPGLAPTGVKNGLEEAKQLGQAFELQLPSGISASIGGYYHVYEGLADGAATCSAKLTTCEVDARAEGRSYGLELVFARAFSESVGGLLSYTWSRSERTYLGETVLADFDRPHVLHAALGYRFAEGWSAGVRVSAYSGRPYSLVRFDDPEHPDEPTLVGGRNVLRRPAFARVDARLERRFVVGETGYVTIVLEGLNVTLSKEIIDVDCRAADFLGTSFGIGCGGEEIGPIVLPSLGVGGGF